MRILLTVAGGLLALGWGILALDYASGARKRRILEEQPPYPDTESGAPSVSVVLAACNEEEKLPQAFRTLLSQEYPGPFEVVAVDDRSTDSTPSLLDALARERMTSPGQVVVLHITELPPGWLGKTHALYQGASQATGRWILFTDADIHFAPDALSRAVRYAETEGIHHLSCLMSLDLRGFWEHVFGIAFSFLFAMRYRPWRVRDPKAPDYMGIGAFNLVRRDAYEAIGRHRAIALEVADDMELGRRIKNAGFLSEVIGTRRLISVRWQEGFTGLMNGLTKNAYAGLEYSPLVVVASSGLLVATVLWPALATVVVRDFMARALYASATTTYLTLCAHHARTGGIPAAYALTLPLSCLLMVAVMFRSAFVTEKSGGITWRGTFYPLKLLRAKPIPPEPPCTPASRIAGRTIQ